MDSAWCQKGLRPTTKGGVESKISRRPEPLILPQTVTSQTCTSSITANSNQAHTTTTDVLFKHVLLALASQASLLSLARRYSKISTRPPSPWKVLSSSPSLATRSRQPLAMHRGRCDNCMEVLRSSPRRLAVGRCCVMTSLATRSPTARHASRPARQLYGSRSLCSCRVHRALTNLSTTNYST